MTPPSEYDKQKHALGKTLVINSSQLQSRACLVGSEDRRRTLQALPHLQQGGIHEYMLHLGAMHSGVPAVPSATELHLEKLSQGWAGRENQKLWI